MPEKNGGIISDKSRNIGKMKTVENLIISSDHFNKA
jgi:hypothetical protein